MISRESLKEMPFLASLAKAQRGGIGILLIPLLFMILQSCDKPAGKQWQVVSGVVHTEAGNPLGGAKVRVQTTQNETTSGLDGSFTLSILQGEEPVNLTAWAPGYFNAGPVSVNPTDTEIKFELIAHAEVDNPDYHWLNSQARPGQADDQSCSNCHSSKGAELTYSLPVDEWQVDAHANSGKNILFLTMYSGTDIQGNQSPPTKYISKKDYGSEPIKPDPTLPYYGPGYKLDFPDTAGNCAACHTPAAAIQAPYNTDPTRLKGIESEGIPCDFCHKIWAVKLDANTGLPYQNMPGVLSFQFRRPPQGHQFFAGPLDDVAPGEDTFSALQTQSMFCAACHHGVFWDIVIYDSFGEWLRSPYSDPDTGQTCQDCHMPRLGADHFALPEQGGLTRDASTIYSHKMPGASDEALLQNAVSMSVDAAKEANMLQIKVNLTNDQTGHHVPTDSPLRHLILWVSAQDSLGQSLVQIDGPQLPDWCGEGDPGEAHYAGQPGMVYAKVLGEQWTNISPTAAYWNPTYLVSDNRLAAFSSSETNYTFDVQDEGLLYIQVRLLYRRAYIELAELKGWQLQDILMEETILEIVP